MKKDHPLPSEELDDLEFINALKAMNPTQKRGIIDRILKLHSSQKDQVINSSCTHQKKSDKRQ